ncbi:Neelaredoxin [Veillonella montpellierensis DNF00314]|uniref:Neelaredoxin n=1 Tax=Veillonella montpellierensis DNF00314 TaxID=1401067 RepID=A0A096CS43_9FIRM|nr:class II SORL domain-containing protein [Veillonella montpellierensis]KGF48164.1 Neelaredoxin [Veillonella montpellierensis DNF00314]
MAVHDYIKSADFKNEKHVPVIDCADTFKVGEKATIEVAVGKEIAHPNTTEHHINWIKLYFVPEGTQVPYEVGAIEFNVHGESAAGANEGPVFAEAEGSFKVTFKKSGKLIAVSYCNIHGLWESEKDITVA